MPDDQTIALINQLQLRVIDLEIAVSHAKRTVLRDAVRAELVDESRRNVRDRALAQMKHEMECQTQNAEKSKQSSGDHS